MSPSPRHTFLFQPPRLCATFSLSLVHLKNNTKPPSTNDTKCAINSFNSIKMNEPNRSVSLYFKMLFFISMSSLFYSSSWIICKIKETVTKLEKQNCDLSERYNSTRSLIFFCSPSLSLFLPRVVVLVAQEPWTVNRNGGLKKESVKGMPDSHVNSLNKNNRRNRNWNWPCKSDCFLFIWLIFVVYVC